MFVAYTLLALPAIGGLMGYVVWNAPSIFNRTAAAVSARMDLIHETVARGNWTSALLAALEILILALPAIGLAFFLLVIARAVTRFVWRRRAAPGAPAADPVEPGGGLEGDPGPNPSSRAEPEGEPLALQAAIADHLALKRRREERNACPAHHPSTRVQQA